MFSRVAILVVVVGVVLRLLKNKRKVKDFSGKKQEVNIV
jgi:hypothetical protein